MKECPKCGGEMELESFVDDTEKADISFVDAYICEDCGFELTIEKD